MRRVRLGAQAAHLLRVAWRNTEDGQVKSRDEHLIRAKQRAHICVDMGGFADAVRGLRADLAKHPLTQGVISSDQALRGFKRRWTRRSGPGSQALTEWVEGFK